LNETSCSFELPLPTPKMGYSLTLAI